MILRWDGESSRKGEPGEGPNGSDDSAIRPKETRQFRSGKDEANPGGDGRPSVSCWQKIESDVHRCRTEKTVVVGQKDGGGDGGGGGRVSHRIERWERLRMGWERAGAGVMWGGGEEEEGRFPNLALKGLARSEKNSQPGPNMQRMPQRVGLESRPGRHRPWCAKPTRFLVKGEERERCCSRIESQKAWG